MNQKYLSGSFSNVDGSGGTVFFEATPENISAFLMEHRSADTSMVGTADGKPFLTALTGFIDVCPDQAYLCEKLLPVYARVQMGEVPVPELKTVPKEAALAEECPMPDWNYMRWGGCSDEKYQTILHGALLRMSSCGCDYDLEVQVGSYCDNGNLAIQLADWTDGEPEPLGVLTVNLGMQMRKDCAFVDVNNLGDGVLAWIEESGLGKFTGRWERSGYVEYPEVCFDAQKLQELDGEGYQKYAQIFAQKQPPISPAMG